MKVHVVTLGCSKNLVDSEHLLAQFKAAGHSVIHDRPGSESDLLIINTCGFILDAKQESIDTILEYSEEKKRGRIGRMFVMGCLSERYREDLIRELPEVDGFFGVWELREILEAAGERWNPELRTDRVVTTPSHYAYLKVAEGCNRSCSFCAIPGIRGAQRSVAIPELISESRILASRGVRELILVAQDLTAYGTDLYRRRALPGLLKELLKVNGIDWIRLHYAYPHGFPEEVIELMASEDKICNYLDIPVQHITDNILSGMGRGHNREKLEALLHQIREGIPGVAIRTTVMTGFPGETETAFSELKAFLSRFRFDRLGVFPYSEEEGTPAARELEDRIPEPVKRARAEEIMAQQQEISLSLNQKKVGEVHQVMIDREEAGYYVGRTQHDSPEVDQEVLVEASRPLQTGEFYRVLITGAAEFDLYGRV